MDFSLERARELKRSLVDFVLDAEGALARSLEAYTAEQLTRAPSQDIYHRDFVIDSFAVEGQVDGKSPLNLFLENQPDLSADDRALVQAWHRSFIGLFSVQKLEPEGFEAMNWLTAQSYFMKLGDFPTADEQKRLKLGEILLARIAPLPDGTWMVFGPATLMGNLGKPKLAVAIGNFKENYRPHLYSDAPELLEAAWESVERYHQDFVDFFGGDEVTLPGYQLGKKLTEFQQQLSQKKLAEAGIDDSKSLAEMAEEAGVDEEELAEAAEALGSDAKTIQQAMKNKKALSQMVTPQVELPPELKKAEQVTVLAHPRWGQMFLPDHPKFIQLLEAEPGQDLNGSEKLVRRYLETGTINTFVWRRLAAQYPNPLETVLQTVLERPEFRLDRDLDSLMQEFHKPLEPDLPEIASVPLHLHELFQDAVAEVSKSKAKEKGNKKKSVKGFQRA